MQELLDALNELTRANEAQDDAAFAAASAKFLDKMTDFVGDSRPAATSIDELIRWFAAKEEEITNPDLLALARLKEELPNEDESGMSDDDPLDV